MPDNQNGLISPLVIQRAVRPRTIISTTISSATDWTSEAAAWSSGEPILVETIAPSFLRHPLLTGSELR